MARPGFVARASVPFLLIALLAIAALQGETQPPDASGSPRQRLAAQVGLASVVGFLGATWTPNPRDLLRLELGLGLGASGVQLSFLPQLALGAGPTRFVAGAGLSAGLLSRDCKRAPTFYGSPPCLWANLDLGVEHTDASGFVFFASAGITVPLQRVSLGGGKALGALDAYFVVPQLRLGFGWDSAAAGPGDDPRSPWRISLQLGVAPERGAAGVALSWAFSESTRLALAAGYGFPGLYVSLLPSFSFGSAHNRFVASAPGLTARFLRPRRASLEAYLDTSLPPFDRIDCPEGVCVTLDAYPLGYEHLSESGLVTSVGIGVVVDLGDRARDWEPVLAFKLELGYGSVR